MRPKNEDSLIPPAPSFARNPHPREFEGDSRRSRTARKLREIVEINAQTAVGCVKDGKAETAFLTFS